MSVVSLILTPGQPQPDNRRDRAPGGRNPRRVRESPPDDTHSTGRFHAAGSRRISHKREREDRAQAVDYVLRLRIRNSAERGKRAAPVIDRT